MTLLKKYLTSTNLLLFVIILLCIFAIFPFIYLLQYNIPGASDDFFHAFFLNEKSYFDGVWYWYKGGYNGRFANAFFMQIPGRIFMESWFAKIFPLVLILSFYGGIFYLLNSITGRTNWKKNLIFSLVIITFFLGFISDIHQFYWYSGATVYIIPAVLYLFFVGLQIRFFNKKQNILTVLVSLILLFFIIGSHENWMVVGFITVILFFINSLAKKEKISKISYVVLIWTIITTLMILLSPGTVQRLVNEGNDMSNVQQNAKFFESLIISFFNSGNGMKDWFLNWGFILAIIAMILLPSKKENTNKLFSSYSNIFLFFVFFIIVYAGFFIMAYSLGHFNEVRVRGVIPNYIVATLMLLFIVYRIKESPSVRKFSVNLSPDIGYTILCFALIIGLSGSINVKEAYVDIFSGRAEKDYKTLTWIDKYIKEYDGEERILIPQVHNSTSTLYLFNIPERDDDWYFWIFRTYYGKEVLVDRSRNIEEFIKVNSGVGEPENISGE